MAINLARVRGHIHLCKIAKFLEEDMLDSFDPDSKEGLYYLEKAQAFSIITECLYKLSSEMSDSEINISDSFLRMKGIIK